MQEINNYGDLKIAVQTWLNRKDNATINNLPMFINFAEKEFARIVRLPYYEDTINRVVIPDNLFIELPKDFLSVKHFVVNGKIQTRTDVETFTRVQHQFSADKMIRDESPYYFARIGNRIFTHPALTPGDQVSLIYNRDIPEMKEENDCPYSLMIAPDVMLYLCLRHASIFLRDNEQEMYWAQKANDAALSVNQQLDEAEWSGSSLVVKRFDEVY